LFLEEEKVLEEREYCWRDNTTEQPKEEEERGGTAGRLEMVNALYCNLLSK